MAVSTTDLLEPLGERERERPKFLWLPEITSYSAGLSKISFVVFSSRNELINHCRLILMQTQQLWPVGTNSSFSHSQMFLEKKKTSWWNFSIFFSNLGWSPLLPSPRWLGRIFNHPELASICLPFLSVCTYVRIPGRTFRKFGASKSVAWRSCII